MSVLRWGLLTVPGILSAHAAAQPTLYGIRANGELIRIDHVSGSAAVIASTGLAPVAATTTSYYGGGAGSSGGRVDAMLTVGAGASADQTTFVSLRVGTAGSPIAFTGRPLGYHVGSLARGQAPASATYALLMPDEPGQAVLLGRFDTAASLVVIGSTGRADLESLASAGGGPTLYAVGASGGGRLFSLDPSTGVATLIGGGDYGGDTKAMAVLPDGTLLICGAGLRSLNRQTGASTLIGPTGFADVRGLMVDTACYADCDPYVHHQGPIPLDIQDFACFLFHYTGGYPYANCDHSTTPPVLNVADFSCFLERYARACQ